MVFASSFFNNMTTSSTFLLDTISRAMCSAFLRTSMSVLDSTRKISIARSLSTPSFFFRSWSTFSRTINLTLLSETLMQRSMNLAAAALTATGLLVKAVKLVAAS
jgi:hypothetical protein